MTNRGPMLLQVDDLTVRYRTGAGAVHAVDRVSLSLRESENLGLVGESGCGKTTVAKALLGVLPQSATTSGNIRWRGQELLGMPTPALNKVRWREIAMITQSALNALDPVHRVGDQIVETLRVHTELSRARARARAEELFALVGLERSRLDDYPHQLSGGMRQRVVIAIALALDPQLIVADEPTTALDVVVQDGILTQLRHVQEQLGNSMILVTHDISVVAETCQRTAVMYAGRLAEVGPTAEIFKHPAHPYTMGLLNAYPTLESAKGELISIPGSPPDLLVGGQDAGDEVAAGCRFAPRCPFATDVCRDEDPPQIVLSSGHVAACHHADRAAELRAEAQDRQSWERTAAATATRTAPPAPERVAERGRLEVRGLQRHFPLNSGIFAALLRETDRKVHAVDGVSIDIAPGEILGLAGESGSGKSTIGEVITGLQPATSGEVRYDGDVVQASGRRAKAFRRRVQMVFQDPYQTLNPRFTVEQAVTEPLRNFRIGEPGEDRRERVDEALRRAGLPPEQLLDRYPHELSGGQRQRVAIARGIVTEPALLVADEPVSMLDVSIRAGVLNLFKRFRDELGMSILYISHDLATIRYICDRTAILYLGRVVEMGPTEDVIERPRHPYTRLLLSAVPRPEPGQHREHVDARGEIPSPVDLPNGCRFHARCHHALAGAGWEGRDLLGLIESRRVAITDDPEQAAPGEHALLAGVRPTVDGLDLLVDTGPAGSEDVADYLKGMMAASGRTIGDAVTGIDTDGQRIRVAFAPVEEPGHHAVRDGHLLYCGTAPWCGGVRE